MNIVILWCLLILVIVLISMLVMFIIALSTGHSFVNSLLCGITYYRICNNEEKYKQACHCGAPGIPESMYNSNISDGDYNVIGGVSGLGWVL